MGIRYWITRPVGRYYSSYAYLDSVIHRQVMEKYYKVTDEQLDLQEATQAAWLTTYFNEIKITMEQLETGATTISEKSSEFLFYKILKQLLQETKKYYNDNKKDTDPQYLFMRNNEKNADSPVVFEKEIDAIMQTFTALSSKDINTFMSNQTGEDDTLKISYRLGDKWSSTQTNRFSRFATTKAVKKAANHTERTFTKYLNQQTGKLEKKYAKKDWKFEGRQMKIDVGNNVQFTIQDQYGMPPWIHHFAQLLSYATFSAKSYQDVLTGKGRFDNLVSLGKTNILAVLLQILPTLRAIQQLDRGGGNSFMAALLTRYFLYEDYMDRGFKRNPQPGQGLQTMSLHFFHLQTIYELTGIGQQAKKDASDDLKEMMNRGVKFLIINEHNSDIIKVYSVRALLKQRYRDSMAAYGRNIDYHRGANLSAIERYVRAY